jgi:hypothetical protein
MEGAKLVEQRLIEKNYEEVFSLFKTLQDIGVFQIFYILQVYFEPTCLQVQSFDLQQGKDMDVHESQLVLKATSTQVHYIQFFF